MVGEVGEHHHPIELMGKYTSGHRLHMAYSFEMLEQKYGARHFRRTLEEFAQPARRTAGRCGRRRIHDVTRAAAGRRMRPIRSGSPLMAAMLLAARRLGLSLYQAR
ncbi:MAG: hypothetical protein R3D59_07795 [Paracoccaceae bacterium]